MRVQHQDNFVQMVLLKNTFHVSKRVELRKKTHANDLKMHLCENNALQHNTACTKVSGNGF